MRNLLVALVLGLTTASLACGDADTTSTTSKRQGKGVYADPYNDDDPGETPESPADPNANKPGAPPATPGTPAGTFALKVDNATPTIELASASSLTVTVTPANGFVGKVNLAADALPAGVTATFTPATVDLASGQPATAKVDFKSTNGATPSAAGVAAAIKGTDAAAVATAASANMTFKVINALTVTIPTNIEALNAAGDSDAVRSQLPASFAAGVTITILNKSASPYTVHSNGGANFKHGNAIAQNGTEVHQNLVAGTASTYEHGNAAQNGKASIVVQ